MERKLSYLTSISLTICSFFILLITALFCYLLLNNNTEKVSSSNIQVKIEKNQNPINLMNILKENTAEEISQEMVIEEIDLEYMTQYRNNSDLPKGTIQVVQEGRDGRQNAVIIKKYKNDELISEELVSENLIKASVNRIVEIGTGIGTNNYKPKVRRYCICNLKYACCKAWAGQRF